MSSSNIVAFFGATGGCTNAALVLALKAGSHCSALARTPSKLVDMLVADGITKQQISEQLHIVEGDVRSVENVKAVLSPTEGALANVIISGIGMQMGKNMDKTLCEDATNTIVKAIEQLKYPANARPVVCLISTTGITDHKRDVPHLFFPLYHWYLKAPHVDKRKMEQIALQGWSDSLFGGLVLLRPSLLTDGKELGLASIRQGDEQRPVVGYTISRKDVGRWIYEQVVASHFGVGKVAKPVISY